jgi:hypothetical protein
MVVVALVLASSVLHVVASARAVRTYFALSAQLQQTLPVHCPSFSSFSKEARVL